MQNDNLHEVIRHAFFKSGVIRWNFDADGPLRVPVPNSDRVVEFRLERFSLNDVPWFRIRGHLEGIDLPVQQGPA